MTIRAAALVGHGGPEVLQLKDLPLPEPGPGEVRVRPRAVALNHLDVWVRKGWRGLELGFPHVVGADAAGVVDAVGEGVTDLDPGEEVVLSAGHFCGRCIDCIAGRENLCSEYHLFGEHRPGCAAEAFVAPRRNLLRKPEGLDFEVAAAVGVATLTAWHMLTARARLRRDETVLVHGASSGVGCAAIQIARHRGARVIASTSSDEKAERAAALGADEVINYRAEDLKVRLKSLAPGGVDVVFEHTGELTWPISVRALKVGGRLVTCGATTGHAASIDLRVLFARQLELLGSTMGTRSELATCLELAARGPLAPVIDRVLPLEEIHAGYAALEAADHHGKIVLAVGGQGNA
ncbi:MAG: zinc-binding dehydrogenase [Deltaproteobacteria bacterium]|nr:zinc-binding dehydrogenase [Deltaproteobacteria bacterium]